MDANINLTDLQEFQDINDVINIDASQEAIFMDGQFYIPTNSKAILVPENDNRYVLEAGDIFFNSNLETIFGNTGTVHYIEDGQLEGQEDLNQIVYYTDEVEAPIEFKENESMDNVKFEFFDKIEPSLKRMKLGGEYINLESVLENIGDLAEIHDVESNGYQYIVELGNYDPLEITENGYVESGAENIDTNDSFDIETGISTDVSKITGKDLLTGQTVTLDSYLEKVRNSTKDLTLLNAEEISKNIRKRERNSPLNNLLNKKLTIGKTAAGQNLIGKVIHVGKKETDLPYESELATEIVKEEVATAPETSDIPSILNNDVIENQVTSPVLLEANEITPSNMLENVDERECRRDEPNREPSGEDTAQPNANMVDYVSRTLTSLMNMETISKKLKRKNLSIKVIERVINKNKVKMNVFEIRGYVEMQGGWTEEKYEENWILKVDEDRVNSNEDGSWNTNRNFRKFPETMKLTISVVKIDGVIQSTKVNLNLSQEKCSLCSKQFRTLQKLLTHLRVVHHIVDNQFYCQLCDKLLEGNDTFTQHRQHHVSRNELFPCSTCDKHFVSEAKLTKHMFTHDPDTWKLKCTVCGEVCGKIPEWRKHMMSHAGVKPFSCIHCPKRFITLGDLNHHSRVHESKNCYVCKVCNKKFSRYSNLQRHSEIHGRCNSVSVHSCSVCGCTYNYVSSLTRHIVQNHISAS